ncbi:MAG: DUF423 domain-containing protein [Flavobacteriia bacterium]|nr:DUF423 domain-containing protein [Flavobacteriia bacterium]
MNRKLAAASFFLLAFSVCLGAFGAHALKDLGDVSAQQTFETGVRYQFYGSFVLFLMAFRKEFNALNLRRWIRVFGIGLTLFCGSIYGLVLGNILDFSAKLFGPITPIGGTLMILSLIMIGIQLLRNPTQE